MNIAIIPARIGSTRLPKKNIKLFYKKPIISYAIKEAKKTKLFNKIIVSTDSKEIKKISEFYGAEVPYLRPKYLSNSKIHFNESVKHMIKWLAKKKLYPKNVCCIYPTSPLLDYKQLIKGYKKLQKNNSFVFSACLYRSPPQRSFYLKNGKVKLFNKKNYNRRSQTLKEIYHDAGQFYWGKSENWIREKIIFNSNSSIIKIPYLQFIDINYKDDWHVAEKLYKLKSK